MTGVSAARVRGLPCINGCGTIRYKRNGMCVVCRSTRALGSTPRRGDWSARKEDVRLKRAYGISLEERGALLMAQNFCCAICRTPERTDGHRFCVDHDHRSGRVRGLLCYNCNRALGIFGDSVEAIQRVVDYLKHA